ncbi:uncharacterized protein LOC113797091 [Dermatophagoides pteronyssinus]|uniref:uncharacterized protein LOC113797091 n=1 Tax=Dermatophagoides pteronyssinus TaxID=6956 RepID=UPI003F661E94
MRPYFGNCNQWVIGHRIWSLYSVKNIQNYGRQIRRCGYRSRNNSASNDNSKHFYPMLFSGVCIGWLSIHTMFSEKISRWISDDKNKLPIELEEFISDTIQTSQLNEALKQIIPASFYLSKQIEPITLGTFQTHSGACILLPFYFQYNTVDQIDDSYVCKVLGLNYSHLCDHHSDDGKPMIEHLKQCLILSTEAKRFALTSLLHNNAMPAGFYADCFSLFIFPFLANESANLLQKRLRQKNPVINLMASMFGYFAYYLINPWFKQTQTRYGYWCVYKYESSDIQKGCQEYFDKLIRLQSILATYQQQSNWTDRLICMLKPSTSYSMVDQQNDCGRLEKLGENLGWSDLF